MQPQCSLHCVICLDLGVKDAVKLQGEVAFSDVSAVSDTNYVSVNERPRFGPWWEAQKAAYKEKKRLNEIERQQRIEEAIRRREEEEQRRIAAGEVESDSGLTDSEDEDEELEVASCHTETTCASQMGGFDDFSAKAKVPDLMGCGGAVAQTLLHELTGIPLSSGAALLARGSAVSAIRSLKN
ncbi:unnamed protein product [Cladocopium goreaui]|uniref:Uncharacterized protein n=1 Tax=Cladocopium goreaui TaxID=2562237 RepID=A0A9P1G1I7_9DINO|nr:unnamed protein product [Cladocopium goreaui]